MVEAAAEELKHEIAVEVVGVVVYSSLMVRRTRWYSLRVHRARWYMQPEGPQGKVVQPEGPQGEVLQHGGQSTVRGGTA